MEYNLSPIRGVERARRHLKFLVRDVPIRVPDGPDIPSEYIAFVAKEIGTTIERHVPVIPVVLDLFETEPLAWVVGPPADRERHTMRHAVGSKDRRNVGWSCNPIVANDGEMFESDCVRQIDHVLPKGRKLT